MRGACNWYGCALKRSFALYLTPILTPISYADNKQATGEVIPYRILCIWYVHIGEYLQTFFTLPDAQMKLF